MAFANGLAKPADLAKTHNGHTLIAAAAASYDLLAVAFKKKFGKDLAITQGYRTLAEQTAIFQARYVKQTAGGGKYGDVRFWKGVRYVRAQGASAAVPGTSNHGLGLALDLATSVGFGSFTSAEYKWMATNGPAYGWTGTEGRSVNEPWHWVYNAAIDKHKPAAKPAQKTEIQTMAAKLPVIKPGDKGIYVKRLQGLLLANGYSIGKTGIDGSNGPSTQAGFAAFQKAHPAAGTNGKPDHICGPTSWALLLGAQS